jgi:putative endonuclease
MYYTYILQSIKDKNLYIGYTDNLKRRLKEHNASKNFSTKSRGTFKLLYCEALPTKEEALERERFYKSGRGHEVLYKILFKSLTK